MYELQPVSRHFTPASRPSLEKSAIRFFSGTSLDPGGSPGLTARVFSSPGREPERARQWRPRLRGADHIAGARDSDEAGGEPLPRAYSVEHFNGISSSVSSPRFLASTAALVRCRSIDQPSISKVEAENHHELSENGSCPTMRGFSEAAEGEGHIRRGRHDWADDLEQMHETWIHGKSGIAKKARRAKEFLILPVFSPEQSLSKGQLFSPKSLSPPW